MFSISNKSVKFVSPALYQALNGLESVYVNQFETHEGCWLVNVKEHQVPFKIDWHNRQLGELQITFYHEDRDKTINLNVYENPSFMALRIYDGASSVFKPKLY